MWKRETPPIAAISSSVSAFARWLSIYQSALWAGFMDNNFRSKHPHHVRSARASFDRRCSGTNVPLSGKMATQALLVTCSHSCILRPAFNPTAHQAAPQSRLPSLGEKTSGRTMMHHRILSHANSIALAGLLAIALAGTASAQKKYDPGATDPEIKVGNIMPYSGPASSYATIGKTEAAYFNKINAEGGINGRKINFISYDDGYNPAKTVEQARKLVEADEVLLIFNPLGTPSNSAIQKYMNAKKVPQIFVSTGAAKWNDPKNFPWTMGWQPNYQT